MNVASLELCKELYELSRWTVTPGHTDIAYDLGYLLRKLPGFILTTGRNGVRKWYFITSMQYETALTKRGIIDNPDYDIRGDTPEDAACKLAIELFKQGVLPRGGE